MKLPLLLAVAGIALGLAAPLAPAQATKSPAAREASRDADVDAKAKEFIEANRAAITKLSDVSCTVSQTSDSGDSKTTHSGDFLATLARRGKGPAMPKLYRIAVNDSETNAIWAFDGKTAYRIDNKGKTFAKADAPQGAFPPGDAAALFPVWARGQDVLSNPGATITEARFLPDTTLDGVKCRVVQYTVEVSIPMSGGEDEDAKPEPMTMTLKQVRSVGADDMMPRKLESTVSYKGGPEPRPPSTFSGVYTNVKVNTTPSATAFALKSPEGYKTIEADPEDLGVPSDGDPKLKFAVGDSAPAFTLKSPDGSEVSLASLKGKVVLLDFWATWCGPCKMAMPGVQKLHEKYAGKAVSVFGVDTFEHGAGKKAKKYMDDHKYTYGLLLEGDSLAKQYGISGIPTFILIGPDGKILHIGVGYDPDNEDKLAEKIDKALNSKS